MRHVHLLLMKSVHSDWFYFLNEAWAKAIRWEWRKNREKKIKKDIENEQETWSVRNFLKYKVQSDFWVKYKVIIWNL